MLNVTVHNIPQTRIQTIDRVKVVTASYCYPRTLASYSSNEASASEQASLQPGTAAAA